MQKHQTRRAVSFEVRLARQAARARAEAQTMPTGKDHDALIERARQVETAAELNAWLTSPGLKSPQYPPPER
jgi:hypothetical protein